MIERVVADRLRSLSLELFGNPNYMEERLTQAQRRAERELFLFDFYTLLVGSTLAASIDPGRRPQLTADQVRAKFNHRQENVRGNQSLQGLTLNEVLTWSQDSMLEYESVYGQDQMHQILCQVDGLISQAIESSREK